MCSFVYSATLVLECSHLKISHARSVYPNQLLITRIEIKDLLLPLMDLNIAFILTLEDRGRSSVFLFFLKKRCPRNKKKLLCCSYMLDTCARSGTLRRWCSNARTVKISHARVYIAYPIDYPKEFQFKIGAIQSYEINTIIY